MASKVILPRKESALFLLILILAVFTACRKPGGPNAKTRPDQPANAYVLGDVVCFGENGSSDLFKEGGWGVTEEDFTWTNGTSARLAFTLPPATQPLKLRMRLKGFVDLTNWSFQPVGVYVNNEKITDWQVIDLEDYFAVIPPAISDHVQLLVELRIPKAVSPKLLGFGSDSRMLGVCCFELAITEGR